MGFLKGFGTIQVVQWGSKCGSVVVGLDPNGFSTTQSTITLIKIKVQWQRRRAAALVQQEWYNEPTYCPFFQKMIISKVLIWPWTLIIKVDQCSYGSCVKRRAKLALQQSRYSHFQVQKIKKFDFDEFFEVESSCLWGSLETYSDPLYACKRSISYSYIYSLCLRLTTPALFYTKSF